jgi:geranylgeranyl pyrophosphate synthase
MVALAADSVLAGGAPDSRQLLRLVEFQRHLHQVLGCNSLVGGQAWDLELNDCQRRQKAESLANQKTAPLFELAARAGLISSDAPPECHERIVDFARVLGVLFQLIDDSHEGDKTPRAPLQNELSRVLERLDLLGSSAGELAHLLEYLIARGVAP